MKVHTAGLLICALQAAPTAALAQTTAGGLQFGNGLLLTLGVTISAIVITVWALWQRQIAIDRSLNAEAALQFDHLLMEEGTASYLAIHPNGDIVCSDRVREWLDMDRRPHRIEDLSGEHGLGEEGKSLLERIEALHEDGVPFSEIYKSDASGVALYVVGRRIWSDRAESNLEVVSFSDISDLEPDRVDLLKDLEESERRRRILTASLDAVPFPVWLRDRKLDLAWVNRAYLQAVDGSSVKDAVTRQVELTGPALTKTARDMAALAKTSRSAVFENHFVVIGKERRRLKIFEIPHDGNDAGLVGLALDETDLEKIRGELTIYMESYSETLDRLSTPVAIFRPDQTLQFFNSAFLNLWKLPEDWLSGEPTHGELLEWLRQNQRLPEQADFLSWKQEILGQYTRLIEPVEEMWHLPDGRALRVVTQPHPMGGLLVIFEDVTDRLALERSYNTLIAVQKATLDHLHEAVAVVGSDGRLRLFNPNYASVWELSPSFLETSPHISEVLEKCRPLLEGPQTRWEETKARIQGYTITRDPKVGRWSLNNGSTLEFSVVPLPDGATLFTIIDITDSVGIEDALRERTEALFAADRLKSEFIGNISYEFRTPLNSIIGFAELLHNEYFGPLNERQKEYTDASLKSSKILKELIDDLLEISVIEAGKAQMDNSRFDLETLIDEVTSDFAELFALKEFKVDLDFSSGAGEVIADRPRIRTALESAYTNLLTFCPGGSRLRVSTTGKEESVEIKITGTSSHLESRAAADKNWVSVKTITAKSEISSSLGLTLAGHIMELHGGSFDAGASEFGELIIHFDLPRRPPELTIDLAGPSATTEAAEEADLEDLTTTS